MASVILQSVGTYFGGPIGGAIGAVVGAAIDSRISAALAPTQRIEGPRLEDVRLTASSEGAVIPRVYGRMRLGGNIIWATDFREETRTTGQGGGKGAGGGGTELTEYLYYASFAVGLCEGVIAGVGRIWADGKPLDVPGAVYRVYRGNEEQTPDPLVEQMMGAGNAPAYRGTAYIVFDNLPLERFGNRIPQLSFEIMRPLDDPESAEELIRSVDIIPSAGEFVYATETILRGAPADTAPENVNSSDPRPDIRVSLDQLESAAPNLEAASLVVSWFGTDLRCGSCEIRPGVEHTNKTTTPKAWEVDGVERADAHPVSRLPDSEDPAYGGTPADFAVVQAIQELKARGLRVTFYPFVLMDIAAGNELPDPYSDDAGGEGQPVYPWRGRVTCSPAPGFAGSPDQSAAAAAQVTSFFGSAEASDFTVDGQSVSWAGGADWGFRRMILHYAHLCAAAGGVNAFLIGSEMRGLTQIRSGASAYPAIGELIDLAAECRSILGAQTKISYAADWSEYFGHHPGDGSGDVYFHLDPLWADSDIDFIGIDNYMPLSDWRDGFSHADAQAGWNSIYDREYLASNIEGGEGFDWFYASAADRDGQVRTTISDGAGKPWVFRYKDLRSWWSNSHYDRPGGIEAATPTDWQPESKPIRFTEAGCPAVDKGANQPNVFVDPKSSESFLPYYSRGARDDAIQRRYIEALHLYWVENNPVSAAYEAPMVELGDLSIWTWDARPFPAFPGRANVWGDAENWSLGHWLTGRLGLCDLAQIVRDLCLRAGLPESRIDVTRLADTVLGYAIEALESPRGSLEPLARYFGFDAVESAGLIRFIPRGGAPAANLGPADIVAARRGGEDIELIRAQETELPLALKWRLVSAGAEYGGLTVEARRITVETARINAENMRIAAAAADADARCRRALMESWIGREGAAFALPPSRLALDPTDIALFEHDGRKIEFRLATIADTDTRRIEAVRTDSVIYGARPGPERSVSLPAATVYGPPSVALMDLPLIDEQVPAHRPYAAVHASPWYGQAAVHRSATQDGFILLNTIGRPARMGELAFAFHSGPVARFDLANPLDIDLLAGTLASVTDIELFGGANAIAIESESGVWEVVQFGQAELVDTGRYRLTRLLRGQMGTEGAMRDPAPAGARCVVLDSAIAPLSIASADVGLAYNWRIGPASAAVGDDIETGDVPGGYVIAYSLSD